MPLISLLALSHYHKASQERRGNIIGMSTLFEFDSNMKQICALMRWRNTPGQGFGSKNATYNRSRAASKPTPGRNIYIRTNMHSWHRYSKGRQSFTENAIEEIVLIRGQCCNSEIVAPCRGDFDLRYRVACYIFW
jgi:hypothetical protein